MAINFYDTNYILFTAPQTLHKDSAKTMYYLDKNILRFKENKSSDLYQTDTVKPQIIYYESYYDKVNPATKTAVINAINECQKHVNPDFFKGLSIHVASDFSQLDDHNAFSKLTRLCEKDMNSALGITYIGNDREIYIQERILQSQNHMKNIVLHEMGHSFDEYYGCKNKKMQAQYYCLRTQSLTRQLTPAEKQFMKDYEQVNNYSDTPEFKETLIKDFNKMDVKKASKEFEYLLHSFVGFICKKPSAEKIKENDYGRAEIFAQLFAYAVGADEKKEEFLKLFPNANKFVLNCIQENK